MNRRAEGHAKQKHWENDLFVGKDNEFSTSNADRVRVADGKGEALIL